MPIAVKCNLFLYADVFQSKNGKNTIRRLNEDFANICGWFVEYKQSIHFVEHKTKSTLFTSKHKNKKLQRLEIIYNITVFE